MSKIHRGATLTPHFRDFLPTWLARQPWYRGTDIPSLSPIGYLRMEDPAGQVGVETHVLTDTWHPHGADHPAVTGRLAAIRLAGPRAGREWKVAL